MDHNPSSVDFELRDDGIAEGYAVWSATYDQPVNPLVALEQQIVRSLIDAIPRGRALDAACGTGRHTEYLCARGFGTVGVDVTPEMLEIARQKVPSAQFVAGDLTSLDFPDAMFDLAVCALALEHCADLLACISELVRVVRPSGAIIISTFHPMSAALGGGAFYRDAEGKWRKVRTIGHRISDYINAFVKKGLDINGCVEAPWGERELAMMRGVGAFLKPETLNAALVGVPCALVWRLMRR
jgi:ubiquinone/menaquinone biosynthesis C-methylase UbiE